jgi:Ran GTPase-activating protein (RanGAP) involved in mRNA processing and transport
MWKNLPIPLYNDQNTASTRWLIKVSQMLVDDNWPNEQPITFDGSGFPTNSLDAATRIFFSSVRRNGKVRSLGLKNATLCVKSQKILLNILSSNKDLRRLEFCNVSTNNPSGCLNDSFFSNSNIEDLTLHKCKINKEISSALGGKIRSGTLKKLKLVKLDLNMDAMELIEGIGKGSLCDLELRDVRADKRILSRLIRGLAFNMHLEKLHLQHCGIDATFVNDLCSLFAKNQSMKSLSLYMNDLDGASIGILKDSGLQHNHTLKSLVLSYNPIGDDGARHLKDLLITNPTIESLYLVECDIWNPGCISFIEGLTKMQGLKRLVVDSEWEDHADILLKAIQVNFSLIQLWTDQAAILMKTDSQWKQIGFYLRLNHAKRRILVEPSVPVSMWSHVLAQSNRDANVLHHFLTHKPDLIPTTH